MALAHQIMRKIITVLPADRTRFEMAMATGADPSAGRRMMEKLKNLESENSDTWPDYILGTHYVFLPD